MPPPPHSPLSARWHVYRCAAYLTLALVLLAGCSSPVRTQVRGITPLNVNDTNESTPVDVRFYQLAATARFEKAPFEALWLDAAKELEDELLAKPVIVSVAPGQAGQKPMTVELGELKEATRFIGVMALYRRSDGKPRVLIIPRDQADDVVIELTGYTIRLGSRS